MKNGGVRVRRTREDTRCIVCGRKGGILNAMKNDVAQTGRVSQGYHMSLGPKMSSESVDVRSDPGESVVGVLT